MEIKSEFFDRFYEFLRLNTTSSKLIVVVELLRPFALGQSVHVILTHANSFFVLLQAAEEILAEVKARMLLCSCHLLLVVQRIPMEQSLPIHLLLELDHVQSLHPSWHVHLDEQSRFQLRKPYQWPWCP